MKGRKLLGIFHVHRRPRFVVEDHFVLGPVIFEHAANVLPAGNQKQEADEDGHANHAVRGIESDTPLQRGIPLAKQRHQV